MKPRVAIVLPYFGSGGAENMVSRLASHLDLSRVEAEVICLYGQPLQNRLEKAVIENGVTIKFIGKGKGFSVGALYRLWKELSGFKPSVVHTHLSACVYCAPWIMMHKARMLHTIHNTPEFELIKPKQKVMALLYKLKKAVPVAISHEIQTMMVEYYGLCAEPELVYNPVDVARFNVPKEIHRGINIVTVGRLSKQKNQRLLIEAVSKVAEVHRDVTLNILGDGPLREDLEVYIKDNSLEDIVHLLGNINNVEDYLAEADIFALSSSYEGLPLVILEAMAAGLPIVSTDVGGVRDIVTNNGILVPNGERSALIAAILKLIDSSELRQAYGERSLENVKQYDSTQIAQQYVELYRKYDGK